MSNPILYAKTILILTLLLHCITVIKTGVKETIQNFTFKDSNGTPIDGGKLNLVVFGERGSGKSAFINSLHFAISGEQLKVPGNPNACWLL